MRKIPQQEHENQPPGFTPGLVRIRWSTSIKVEGHTLRIGVSIGIALYPEHGKSQKALMEASDAAMYRAKRQDFSFESASSGT